MELLKWSSAVCVSVGTQLFRRVLDKCYVPEVRLRVLMTETGTCSFGEKQLIQVRLLQSSPREASAARNIIFQQTFDTGGSASFSQYPSFPGIFRVFRNRFPRDPGAFGIASTLETVGTRNTGPYPDQLRRICYKLLHVYQPKLCHQQVPFAVPTQ